MIKNPNKTDFIINELNGRNLKIEFIPTNSVFNFRIYDGQAHLQNYRHTTTGDTAEYIENDVINMACNFASNYVNENPKFSDTD